MNERSKAQEGIIYEGIRSQIVERTTGLLGGERRRYQVPQEMVQQIQSDISGALGWDLPPIKKLVLSPRKETMLTQRSVLTVEFTFPPIKIKFERGSVVEKTLFTRALFYTDEEIQRELHGHKVSGPDEKLLDIVFAFDRLNPSLSATLFTRRSEKSRVRKASPQDLELAQKLLDAAVAD